VREGKRGEGEVSEKTTRYALFLTSNIASELLLLVVMLLIGLIGFNT
jgi:hypothetical protein